MWVALIVALVIQVIAYAMTPKPKSPKPAAAQDLENPTAEAGRPVPVVFGTITVKSPNVLWFGDKQIIEQEIPA